MLQVATLASGSSGNCAVVSDGRVHILIDAGISAKRILTGLQQLGLEGRDLAGILITHEHSDHIAGLAVLCRRVGADLFASEPTAREICARLPGLEERFCVFEPGQRFAVESLAVGSFANSHDCVCPVGYSVSDGTSKLVVCTDTGEVTQGALAALRGVSTLMGEFNYDRDMLLEGPYPYHLKQRILSRRGHLSNQMGAQLARCAVERGARRVVMAHLSAENNRPDVAQRAAREELEALGARVGEDVLLRAAPRSECSGWMEV